MVTSRQRDELAIVLDYLHEHREKVHYPPVVNHVIHRQVEVADLKIKSLADVIRVLDSKDGLIVDCSQLVIVALEAVGIHVPNPNGFTGTLLNDLKPHYTDARSAFIGAVPIFGPDEGDHAAIVRHRDTRQGNPVVLSHGGPPPFNCRYVNVSVESASHHPPTTFCSIANL